jgi:protein tyrosine/serine phosphatase
MFSLIFNILEKIGVCNIYDIIVPNIFLGNYNSSQNLDFLEKNNIKLIINCTRNIPFLEEYDCEKIRIPIDDNRIFKNNDILDYLYVLDKIYDCKEKNLNILVHCRLGSQRSANIVMLYLMKYANLNLDFATQLIKQKRPICFFPFNSFNHIY